MSGASAVARLNHEEGIYEPKMSVMAVWPRCFGCNH